MATKTAVEPAAEQQQTISVDHNTQTEARVTIVGQVLTPKKYKGEPVGVLINRDIVTSSYNPNKACQRLIYCTSTTDSASAVGSTSMKNLTSTTQIYCANHHILRSSA